jgi:hypothetical protein
MDIPVRMRQIRTNNQNGESQIGLARQARSTRTVQLPWRRGTVLANSTIATRSKRKVVSEIARDIERVYGKERLLVEIANAAIEEPSGRICDVIFPIGGKDKLAAIVRESHAKGALDGRIYRVMRGSWASHYRRMLPNLLSILEFRSNNAVWRPVLAALDWIRSKVDDGCRFVPVQGVPIDEVIPARWRSSVIDDDGRVNRISYELCVLTQLRDRLRSKDIWVVGTDRYRNPDDDLPKDFEGRREACYSGLNLTRDARMFTFSIRGWFRSAARNGPGKCQRSTFGPQPGQNRSFWPTGPFCRKISIQLQSDAGTLC